MATFAGTRHKSFLQPFLLPFMGRMDGMDGYLPGTILLASLFLFFLLRRSWRLAFGVLGFILFAGLVSIILEYRFGEGNPATELGISILLIAGCVWFFAIAWIRIVNKGKK